MSHGSRSAVWRGMLHDLERAVAPALLSAAGALAWLAMLIIWSYVG